MVVLHLTFWGSSLLFPIAVVPFCIFIDRVQKFYFLHVLLSFFFSLIVLFSCSGVSNSLPPYGLQHARLPCPSLSPRVFSNSCLLSRGMPPNHLILCHPLLLPSRFPSIRVFSNESVLGIRLAKVLGLQLQHQSFQWIFRVDFFKHWLVWSPCCPRCSKESSPAPQFNSIKHKS